ncbi:hypothetical protein ABFA07_015729 [Porites harrisoni]
MFVIWISAFGLSKEDDCRKIEFKDQMHHKALINHVIRIYHRVDIDVCELNCFLEPNCRSYNYGESGDGLFVCELSDVHHSQGSDGELEARIGFKYVAINEDSCLRSPCPNNATCQTGYGDQGFRCICPRGYYGEKCNLDIKECLDGSHNCSANLSCVDVPGSFQCNCPIGYTGDGFNCSDIKECMDGSHSCSRFASCVDVPGSFQCTCLSGYTGDGVSCIKICDSDWNRHGEKCYKLFTSVKNWNEAKATCDNHGASLVKIESHDENNFISATYLTGQVVDYWIGLSDADHEGVWTWVDGTGLTSYNNWRSDQPNDVGSGQDCVGIRMGIHHNKEYNAEWHDNSCQNTKGFICEK